MSKTIRYFPPLEEWIYIKVYINPIASNFVLINYIRRIVDLIYPSLADNWFFLRYYDTGYHIRVRFHFTNTRNLSSGLKIIKDVLKKAILDGYVHNWTIEGYERELERYGISNILVTEELFCINSQLVSKALVHLSNFKIETNCFALWSIDNILIRFIDNVIDRADFCQKTMLSYLYEMNLSEDSKIPMNKSYRRYKSFLNSLNSPNQKEYLFSKDIRFLIFEYNEAFDHIIEKLDINQMKSLNFGSIVHLNINRLFQTDARKVEMVLYYLLYKKYISDKYKKDK